MKWLNKSLQWIGMLSLVFASLTAFALEAPDKMLERVTQQILTALKQNDQRLKSNPQYIYTIVNQILVPHVEASDMARWVVGRQVWTHANQDQRQRFTEEFKTLMVRTYANSLLAYSNQTIKYFPVRGNSAGKSRVQVSSVIKEPTGQSIAVSYRLVNKNDTWKVYDIIIEGVSLLKGFQSQFAGEIQQDGFEAVINRVSQHNRKTIK